MFWIRSPMLRGTMLVLLLFGGIAPVRAEVVIFREIVGETDVAKLMSWGLAYREGQGVARNIDRAVKLYCKAARDGHPEAQFQLGLIYAKGEGGVAANSDMAAAWFRKAAAQDHGRATEMLVMMNKKGRGHAGCVLSDGRDLYPAARARRAGPAAPAVNARRCASAITPPKARWRRWCASWHRSITSTRTWSWP